MPMIICAICKRKALAKKKTTKTCGNNSCYEEYRRLYSRKLYKAKKIREIGHYKVKTITQESILDIVKVVIYVNNMFYLQNRRNGQND